MSEFVKNANAPIASDGWPIIAGGAGVAFAAAMAYFFLSAEHYTVLKISSGVIAVLGLAFVLFSLWFFRNPERTPESSDKSSVISSADGTVLKVETVNDPRYGAPAEKISIFMSPFNVHVNRAPIAGVVEKVEYVPGKFFAANLDKASVDNERNLVIMKTEEGKRVAFLQIAGFIARRIVCHIKAGDRLALGQRYGMIRFGSRMEIFVPAGSKILVKPGQSIFAGQTVVARLN
jgi:phosphatidylserine decarboxylase